MLHSDEIVVDEELLRQLLQDQFPSLATLELLAVDSDGTDNWLFRLGGDLLVRLPRRPSAALQSSKVHDWLPRLAPALPLRVPTPVSAGSACDAFPWPWSICSWIEGLPAEPISLSGSIEAAVQLGLFVRALQNQEAGSGPPPGEHNSFRGEALLARDEFVRQNLAAIEDPSMRDSAHAVWREALNAEPYFEAPKWIHGDLLPSNLLVDQETLVAVIDFGLLAAGDPACDLMAGWTLFNADARDAFRATVGADEAAWSRGRGWALAFAAVAYPYYKPLGHPLATVAARTMREVLSSKSARGGDA